MSVTADQLGKTGTRSKEIEAVVHDLLLAIDSDLARHPRKWGRNVMMYELPSNFAFPGLARKDAQRVVYCAVVKSLEERGFAVRILIEQTATRAFIEWASEIDHDEVDEMNRYLADHQILQTELQEFLDPRSRREAKTARPPPRPDPPGPRPRPGPFGQAMSARLRHPPPRP